MSDIKHQFTGGKMNKDLDERLIPNGEYRDAMNIQVSTSEGSKVGTVQNILGNELGCNVDVTPAGSVTIGSVADEKNDTLYWLVSGPSFEGVSLQNLIIDPDFILETSATEVEGSNPYYAKDMIMRKTVAGCEPVLVDQYAGIFPNQRFDGTYWSNGNSNDLVLSNSEFLNHIHIGMSVFGIGDSGSTTNTQVVTSIASLQSISTAYSVHVDSIVYGNVSQHNQGAAGGALAFFVSTKLQAVYTTSLTVVKIHNSYAIAGGIQIGDKLTSGGQALFPGLPAMDGAVVIALLGNDLFEIDIPLTATDPTVVSGFPDDPILGIDGIVYYPYHTGVMGSMGTVTVQRSTTTFLNQIELPSNSQWLNEIAGVFYDLTQSPAVLNDTPTSLKIKNNYNWPEDINACLSPYALTVPPYWNGAQWVYDTTYDVVDCTTGVAILPVNAGTLVGKYMDLVVETDAFNSQSIILDGPINMGSLNVGSDATYLYFSGERMLNFSPSKIITGINIIDDMLLWVDGKEDETGVNKIIGTEPKKINIKRSLAGTDSTGNYHTQLINNDITYATEGPLKEEHITVIKKAPKTPLHFDLITERDAEVNYSGVMSVCSSFGANISSFTSNSINRRDFNGLKTGDVFRTVVATDLDSNSTFSLPWSIGTSVVLKEFDEDGVSPNVPFAGNEYRIKGIIEPWNNQNFDSEDGAVQVAIRITSIVGFPPQAPENLTLSYAIDTYSEGEKLFEYKFPRFSYRYKYKDGQISTYAPFTNVAFSPGTFNYHPTKGYNLGMTNSLKEIHIKGFVTNDIPRDVIAIDILYKEDSSSNIYTVDTIKQNDQIPTGALFNHWNSNVYKITSDTIHSVVPSNQLLRAWDNVPRKALTQEITGNRVVYGNYLQNYGLTVAGSDFYPKFVPWLSPTETTSSRSIKSLREYQLGVVFTDKYGRETPVIASATGAFKVPKSEAKEKNSLSIKFDGNGPPAGLEYFKFFIKETSGEYYNLAMDRFFQAEDGNYWLSFPSTERNKIDEESFLILKKGQGSEELVSDKARYKVISIKDDAPDFIKTSHLNIGEVQQKDDTLFSGLTNAPAENKNNFQLIAAPFQSTTLSNLHDMEDELYVEFGVAGTSKVSNRYRVTEVTKPLEYTELSAAFHVKIDGVFGSDVNIITIGGADVIHRAIVRFYKYKVENKSIFDGRFFVKILNDEVFKKNIDKEDISDKEYIVTAEKKVYFMSSDHLTRHATQAQVTGGSADFGAGTAIGDYWQSARAVDLTNFPSAVNSAPTSSMWYKYETYFKNRYYDSPNTSAVFGLGGASDNSGSNGSLHTTHRGVGLENGVVGSRVFEDVMFIDKGTYSGNQNNSPSGILSTGALSSYDQYNGLGISNQSSSGRMDLSFGSLEPENVSGKPFGGANGFKYTNSWENKIGVDGGNFWDLTNSDRTKYNHLAVIYDKIQSGQQFRWKEDPKGTIYTITQQVTNYNINRFDNTTRGAFQLKNHSDDLNTDLYWKDRDSNGGLKSVEKGYFPINALISAVYFQSGGGSKYALSSNFQQKKRFTFTPAMTAWDPTMDDVLGIIDGGAKVTSWVSDWSDPVTFNLPFDAIAHPSDPSKISMMALEYENSFDIENESRTELKGMILTHVGATPIATPVIVHDYNSTTNTISFRGYQGATGDILINESGELEPFTQGNNASLTLDSTALHALTFEQPSMNGLSVNSANNINEANPDTNITAVGYTMQFVEVKEPELKLAVNPAIWETEPKESTDLDIYYEISGSNPITLSSDTIKTVLPIGSKVYSAEGGGSSGLIISANNDFDGVTIRLNEGLCVEAGGCVDLEGNLLEEITGNPSGSTFRVERPNGTSIEVKVDSWSETETNNAGYLVSSAFKLNTQLYNTSYTLDWHNCYSFGNGVESNRVRDTFNLPFITNGVKVSTTLEGSYKEEHRKYGLIYSGIYNSNSGVNNLNQFITAEKITKDINPIYGSIQKLHSRSTADGDLIVLCEDRVLKILADKNALFNADGNPQLVATDRVLGQVSPFSGEFGISKNPESFASESYRVYFADKVRGAIIRLSKDGLTAISGHGMKDWFRDNLKLSTKLIGSYDDRNDEYNITLNSTVAQPSTGETVTFKEDVKGWVSFKSFIPENAISCANEYYTFNKGTLWKQNSETEDRNTFYKEFPVEGEGFTNSSINVIINESPSVIKTFHTLNYEGTQSKINTFTHYFDDNNAQVYNSEYYNLTPKKGWKVQSITTDQEEGSINEFINKEGKWFNYIRGKTGSLTNPYHSFVTGGFDVADGAFHGLGRINQAGIASNLHGCTANGLVENAAGVVNDLFADGVAAFNYDPLAMIDDDASCIQVIVGCTDINAVNHTQDSNTDDGSCIYYGCTDSVNATNYNPLATNDDGTCTYEVYGCTDGTTDADGGPNMNNFNSSATSDCNGINGNHPNFSTPITGGSCAGSPGDNCCCVPVVYGCMDPSADNYGDGINYPLANVQQISFSITTDPCFYTILGCTDSTSCAYDGNANTDNGTCNWCNNALANNYDAYSGDVDDECDNGCLFCKLVENVQQVFGSGNPDTSIDIQWDETWSGNAAVDYYELTYVNETTSVSTTISNIQPNLITGTISTGITGLDSNTSYAISVQAFCVAGTSPINLLHSTASDATTPVTITTSTTVVYGCTEASACNYDANANAGNPSQLCDFNICTGCTDPLADNTTYWTDNDGNSVIATDDTGTCLYTVQGCSDPGAENYDGPVDADTTLDDDGSCTYPPVPGCMDNSEANFSGGADGSGAVIYAASNYNPAATVDDGSCAYIMPEMQTGYVITAGQSELLNTPGWRSGGVWGSYRKTYAVWDVSLSPALASGMSNHKFYWENSANGPYNSNGDINQPFTPAMHFSVDNGASFQSFSNYNPGDPIQLVSMYQGASGNVHFVSHPDEYPPTTSSDPAPQLQRAKFGFNDPNIAGNLLSNWTPSSQTPNFGGQTGSHDTGVAQHSVMLGCNDSDAWNGFSDPIPFYDNTLCDSGGVVDNVDLIQQFDGFVGSFWIYTFKVSFDYTASTIKPNSFQIESVFVPGYGSNYTGNNYSNPLVISITGNNVHDPYGGGSYITPNQNFMDSNNDMGGQWVRYSVRGAIVDADGAYKYTPWVRTWAMIPLNN